VFSYSIEWKKKHALSNKKGVSIPMYENALIVMMRENVKIEITSTG